MVPLSAKFPFEIRRLTFVYASNQHTIGHALKEVLPDLFSLEDLKGGGASCAWIRIRWLPSLVLLFFEFLPNLYLFFFFFFFFFFLIFFRSFFPSFFFSSSFSVDFCREHKLSRLRHRKVELSLKGSVRKYLSQKCSDASKGKFSF